jgi:hypothetical protein
MRKVLLIAGAVSVLVLSAIFIILRSTGVITKQACMSEQIGTFSNLSGLDFEVIYTNCDTLVKDETISVYASGAAASKRQSLLTKLMNRRTLIFRYDPGWNHRAPFIRSLSKNRIIISVPELSSIVTQRRHWRDIWIEYNIERNLNP